MDGHRLLGYLSSFFVDYFEDVDVVERLLDGYIEGIKQRYAQLHRLGLSRSLELAPGTVPSLWERIELAGGAVHAVPGVLSIPRLQDRIRDPGIQLSEGIDYVLEDGHLRFLSALPDGALPDDGLWAPIVLRADESVWSGFGEVLGLSASALPSVRDTREALRILRAVWHASRSGPSVERLHIGANAIAGLPFADHPGRVIQITGLELSEKTVTVAWGDSGTGVVGAHGDRLIAGSVVSASQTAVTDASGTWLYDDAPDLDAEVGDYVSILSPGLRLDARVRKVHDVAPATILPVSTTGLTDVSGRILSDGTDFTEVQPGDLVEVLQPVDRAGHYRVRQVSGASLELEDRLGRSRTHVRYRIVRRPGVQLSVAAGRRVSGLSWRLIRPQKAWPPDVWEQQIVADSLSRQFLVLGNDESCLRLNPPDAAAPTSSWLKSGPFRIRPPYETTDSATYTLDAVLTPTVQVGDVARRFQPLSDGIRLSDWRSTQAGRRTVRALHALTADSDGTDVLHLDSTLGIAKGDTFDLVDQDTRATRLEIAQVLSADTVRADRDLPAGYFPDKMARLVPSRVDVEGLSGHYAVTGARDTGSTDVLDGRLFADPEATFVDDQVLPDQRVRIIQPDGTLEWATVAAVLSQTQLRLAEDIGAGRLDLYYQIVVAYSCLEYFRLSILMAADVSTDRRDALQAFLRRIAPAYLAVSLSPLVQDVYESGRVQELLPALLGWQAQDPQAGGSDVGGQDLASLGFLTGSLDPLADEMPPLGYEQAVSEILGGHPSLTGGGHLLGDVFRTASRGLADDYASLHGWTTTLDVPRPSEAVLPDTSTLLIESRRLPSRTGGPIRTGSGFRTAAPAGQTLEDLADYALQPA